MDDRKIFQSIIARKNEEIRRLLEENAMLRGAQRQQDLEDEMVFQLVRQKKSRLRVDRPGKRQ